MSAPAALARLEATLAHYAPVAVAVSGGVDSMTLAIVAHRSTTAATIYHAVSPAVPAAATNRVRRHAERENWDLRVVDAGELDDPRYVANPVDRCFYCKTNLYGAITQRTDATVLSGTNVDDLGDYRPGLAAATAASVVHPYVDAVIDKATVRAIAAHLGLGDLADLPASPCLSSRIETGLAVRPKWLATIEAVEEELVALLRAKTVRCRLRPDRIAVELDEATLDALDGDDRQRLSDAVSQRWTAAGIERPVTFERYRMGSAFVGSQR